MGSCCAKTKQMYIKVTTKAAEDSEDIDIRHMNVSTMYIPSAVYTITEGDIDWALPGVSLGEILDDPNVHRASMEKETSALMKTQITDDHKKLIDLYILEMQLVLSNTYSGTDFCSFAVIPNKIHHLITAYW